MMPCQQTRHDPVVECFWPHHAACMRSMANGGAHTNSSRFFIMYAKQPNLKLYGFEVLDLMEKDMGIGQRHRLRLIVLQSTGPHDISMRASTMEEVFQHKWAHKQKGAYSKLVIVQAKRVFIVKSFF